MKQAGGEVRQVGGGVGGGKLPIGVLGLLYCYPQVVHAYHRCRPRLRQNHQPHRGGSGCRERSGLLVYVWLYEAAWLNAIGFDHATIDERIMIRVKRRIDIVEAAHMTIRTLVDNYRARSRGPATMSPTATET